MDVTPSKILSSAAVESTAANLVKSAWTNPETPSNKFNSAAVEVIAVLPKVSPPSGTTILLPDCAVKVFAVNWKSSAPAILISIWSSVSAVIVVSPSASKTNSLPSKSRDPPNPASTRFVPSE